MSKKNAARVSSALTLMNNYEKWEKHSWQEGKKWAVTKKFIGWKGAFS
jgi:hypothetical protein